MSFVWDLKCRKSGIVELCDRASTVLTIHEVNYSATDREYEHVRNEWAQRWHLDVCVDQAAPGPATHAQVANQAELPVPRLPSILFTPADCLDFLLGELFQVKWEQHLLGHNQTMMFASAQQNRLQRLLQAHQALLGNPGRLTAWTAFKSSHPADEIFIVNR